MTRVATTVYNLYHSHNSFNDEHSVLKDRSSEYRFEGDTEISTHNKDCCDQQHHLHALTVLHLIWHWKAGYLALLGAAQSHLAVGETFDMNFS